MGEILCRPDDDSTPSQLETLVYRANVMVRKKLDTFEKDKKPLDDWMLTNGRKSAEPFKQSLMDSIGEGSSAEVKGRANRINTTEEIDRPSELKNYLGRQNSHVIAELPQVDEGPWDEKFFAALEQILREHVQLIYAKG